MQKGVAGARKPTWLELSQVYVKDVHPIRPTVRRGRCPHTDPSRLEAQGGPVQCRRETQLCHIARRLATGPPHSIHGTPAGLRPPLPLASWLRDCVRVVTLLLRWVHSATQYQPTCVGWSRVVAEGSPVQYFERPYRSIRRHLAQRLRRVLHAVCPQRFTRTCGDHRGRRDSCECPSSRSGRRRSVSRCEAELGAATGARATGTVGRVVWVEPCGESRGPVSSAAPNRVREHCNGLGGAHGASQRSHPGTRSHADE